MAIESLGAVSGAYKEIPKVKPIEIRTAEPVVTSSAVIDKKSGAGSKPGDKQENEQRRNVPEKAIKNAISQANSKMRMNKNRCEFSYHEATKRVSIKVLDEETSEVIREIPPEETLEALEKLLELAGLLIDEKR